VRRAFEGLLKRDAGAYHVHSSRKGSNVAYVGRTMCAAAAL